VAMPHEPLNTSQLTPIVDSARSSEKGCVVDEDQAVDASKPRAIKPRSCSLTHWRKRGPRSLRLTRSNARPAAVPPLPPFPVGSKLAQTIGDCTSTTLAPSAPAWATSRASS